MQVGIHKLASRLTILFPLFSSNHIFAAAPGRPQPPSWRETPLSPHHAMLKLPPFLPNNPRFRPPPSPLVSLARTFIFCHAPPQPDKLTPAHLGARSDTVPRAPRAEHDLPRHPHADATRGCSPTIG